jgi:hypothetical protein
VIIICLLALQKWKISRVVSISIVLSCFGGEAKGSADREGYKYIGMTVIPVTIQCHELYVSPGMVLSGEAHDNKRRKNTEHARE